MAGRTFAITASRTVSIFSPLDEGSEAFVVGPGCKIAVFDPPLNTQPANNPVPKTTASKAANRIMAPVRRPLEEPLLRVGGRVGPGTSEGNPAMLCCVFV